MTSSPYAVHTDCRRYDTDADLMGMDRATLERLAATCKADTPDPAVCDACAARLLIGG